MYVAWNKKYHLRSERSNMYEDRYHPDTNILDRLLQNIWKPGLIKKKRHNWVSRGTTPSLVCQNTMKFKNIL